MPEEKEVTTNGKIFLDLTSQAKIANTNAKLIKKTLSLLRGVASEHAKERKHKGALIVLGEFVRYDYQVPGMRQIGANPLTGRALYVDGNSRAEVLALLSSNADGAIIVDITGQIMAAQVYLHVEHAEAQVEEECSTRHISAASFSMNDHIVACFTMSEETGKVRYYADGKQVSVYDPCREEKPSDNDDDDDDLDVEIEA
jgi:DNA integrity scanning protein DisA with diadenylate cyclase activity